MLADLRALYRGCARFAVLAPLAFLVPALAEGAQHLVEWRIGMFADRAGLHAAAHDPWRMGFGSLKVLALLLPGYWTVRWLAWGDARRAVRPERAGLRGFAPLLLLMGALTMALLWGGVLGGPGVRRAATVLQIASLPLGLLFAAWSASAPLGAPVTGPVASARLMAPVLPWALGFTIAATLPPMIVHYALNYAAVGRPPALVAGLLALDTLVVGYQALLIAGTNWFMAGHARRRTARRPAA